VRGLKFAPIILLGNAYWMLSNKQIFEGWVFNRDFSNEEMDSGHTLLSTLYLDQSTPLLVTTFSAVLIFTLHTYFQPFLVKVGMKHPAKEIQVEENLQPFSSCIS
jgi:hypothetical protein